MYKIHLLPAGFGDAILIEYGEPEELHFILIDGGPYYEFNRLWEAIKIMTPHLKVLDLLVITHIDIDHIDGIIVLLNKRSRPFSIKEVWFNGFNEIKPPDDSLGVLQGEYLSNLIQRKKIPHNISFEGKAVVVQNVDKLPLITLEGGMILTLLSPTIRGLSTLYKKWDTEVKEIGSAEAIRERLKNDRRYGDENDDLMGEFSMVKLQNSIERPDKSPANISSIAFLATFEDKSALFAGDATTEYLLPSIQSLIKSNNLEKLPLNAWKLSHHGSQKSTLSSLMKVIECKKMMFSTDGKRYHHPDKSCVAKLIKFNGPDISLFFNYRSMHNEIWDTSSLKTEHRYGTYYPENDKNGLTLEL